MVLLHPTQMAMLAQTSNRAIAIFRIPDSSRNLSKTEIWQSPAGPILDGLRIAQSALFKTTIIRDKWLVAQLCHLFSLCDAGFPKPGCIEPEPALRADSECHLAVEVYVCDSNQCAGLGRGAPWEVAGKA